MVMPITTVENQLKYYLAGFAASGASAAAIRLRAWLRRDYPRCLPEGGELFALPPADRARERDRGILSTLGHLIRGVSRRGPCYLRSQPHRKKCPSLYVTGLAPSLHLTQ